MLKVAILCCLLVDLCYTQDLKIGNPTVTIQQGKIEGKDIRYDRGKLDRFLAIPYAKPPTGDLRFRPPEPHPGWAGITYDASGNLNCDLDSKKCLQSKPSSDLISGVVGSEDCLYINVWVPGGVEEARQSHVPVMVWIHGDAYSYGSSWGPVVDNERLYDLAPISLYGNVVAVSFNYRLGPLGFLSTGDASSPGNYGMLDQVMALQWIQDNIWAFGGKADQVTIFGESTGGVSVSLHMLSPLSTDLFQQGISESGTALSQWAIASDSDSAKWTDALAQSVNCTSENSQDLVSCLKTKPADSIVQAVQIYGIRKDSNLDLPWRPVVDGNFLPSIPEMLIEQAASKNYLLGSNNMDGYRFAALDFPLENVPLVPFTELSLLRASRKIMFNATLQLTKAVRFQYKKYTGLPDRKYYKKTLIDLYTDYMFTSPTISFAKQHFTLASSKETGASTFVYLFTEPKERSLLPTNKLDGADHGDELQFVFDLPDRAPLRYSFAEGRLAKNMMLYWTNFAWTGNPNTGFSSDEVPVTWPSYNIDEQMFLELNTDLGDTQQGNIGVAYRGDYVAFWSRLMPQLTDSLISICENLRSEKRQRKTPVADYFSESAFNTNTDSDDDNDFNQLEKEITISRISKVVECDTGDFIRPTSYGCVEGYSTIWNGYLVSNYLGIPYASPPTGQNRFEKSTYPESWTGNRATMLYEKICPQSPYDAAAMDEDCLYLNVYVPVDTTLPYDIVIPGKYAVMVWIHGGGYMSGDGSASYNGEVIAGSQKVIVVTINYRIGALGFLSTGSRFSQGNYGLWDQNLAMQWIRDNIAGFGGDPTRVTIFGQGAGAECAQLHTLSSSSESLGFNQTILQSGTGLSLDEYPDQPTVAEELASRVGCDGLSTGDMVDCLRSTPVQQLIPGQAGSSSEEKLQFAPVVDGLFLLRDPEKMMRPRKINKWKYMIGVNSGDGTTYWDRVSNVTTEDQFRSVIRDSFSDEYGVASDDIEFEYTEWDNPAFKDNQYELETQLFSLFTDQRYIAPASKVALMAAISQADVYMYYLTYPYETSQQSQYPSWTGVMHGGDIPYVWGEVVRTSQSEGANPDASWLSYNVMNYWANFAKTGNPNFEDNGKLTEVEWPMYKLRSRKYLQLDVESRMAEGTYLNGKQMAFWNRLLPSLDVTCPLFYN